MKPVQDSPVCITMQEAFGCAVENRFLQLQDDDCDPLDLLHQASIDVTKRKKKETPAAKKSGNQQGNKKESQKERKIQVVTITAVPDPKRAPKPTLQKVTQNENNGAEVKVDRTERRMAFREFRPNIIEKNMDYNDNFEKERQVRNWASNQRGGSRGRGRGGFPRNMESENPRDKREFDRHSGSDRARVKAEDKRGGSGPHNWGSIKDAFSDADPVPVEHVGNAEPIEASEEEQDVKVSEEGYEDPLKEMSLDEWKSMMDQSRPKADFNLRKPESAMPSKAVVIHKSKFADNITHDEDYPIGFRKPVNDITSQLDINFGNLPRPGRGGRGAGRGGGRGAGRGRVEETFTPPESLNVNDFALNPEDPDHFPALC